MSVKTRQRDLANGMVSTHLDIHIDGKRTAYFFKNLKFKKRPSNNAEKEHKKMALQIISQKKNEIEKELLEGVYGSSKLTKNDIDFTGYFQKYIDEHNYRDKRVYEAVLKKVTTFFGRENVMFSAVNSENMQKLVYYFEKELNGVTPLNYIKKLKRVLSKARKEKYILFDPFEDIKVGKHISAKKDIWSGDDLNILWRSTCGNNNVKRAFYLSCLTGLRFCDIKALKWEHVKSDRITLIQQKTKEQVSVRLNDEAKKILGTRKKHDEYVFNLPSHTGTNKSIKAWVENAKIEKHLTYHSARHGFATNLIKTGADLNTVKHLLGHTSLKYTETYLRYDEELAQKAVNNISKIFTNGSATDTRKNN